MSSKTIKLQNYLNSDLKIISSINREKISLSWDWIKCYNRAKITCYNFKNLQGLERYYLAEKKFYKKNVTFT